MNKLHPSLKSASEDKGNDSVSKSLPTFMIDPRIVVVQPDFNARPIDPDHVAYLKGLRKAGVDTGFYTLQMIDGHPVIRDGHHRHVADMELIAEGFPLQRVKAMEFKGDEKAAILLMLATQSGKQYTPLQVGEQYLKLVNKYGMSFAEIAEQRGMTDQHVKDAIRLTEQPVELKALITEGTVKASTALKLIKKEGSSAAVQKIKQAAASSGVKAGKPITQKVLDNLGHSVVEKAKGQRDAAIAHLEAMLDSPKFDDLTKLALQDVLALVKSKIDRIAPSRKVVDMHVMQRVEEMQGNPHSGLRSAATLIRDFLAGTPIHADEPEANQNHKFRMWLKEMAQNDRRDTFRAAAHWFMAVLTADRHGGEVAPAPSVMSLADALRAEIESGGHVLAETLCPEHAELIMLVRGRA